MPNPINNQAAYAYLKEFKNMQADINEMVFLESKNGFKKLADVIGADQAKLYQQLFHMMNEINERCKGNYDPNYNYQQHYNRLHKLAEKLKVVRNDNQAQLQQNPFLNNWLNFHDKFFVQMFENQAKFTDRIYENVIKQEDDAQSSKSDVHIKSRLRRFGIKPPKALDMSHPDSGVSKFFKGLMGWFGYDPLKETNKPYVVTQTGTKENPGTTVIRMGAQLKDYATQQKAFRNYLASKQRENMRKNPNRPYHHVYFNLLKRDEGDFERNIERDKTRGIENYGDGLGAAVITLPADGKQFFEGFDRKQGISKDSTEKYNVDALQEDIVRSILTNTNDFNMTDDVKRLVLGEDEDEQIKTIRELYQKAVATVIGKARSEQDPHLKSITAAERQAILFEFVKFQLSNHILETLQPDTANFTCKDGIDRGGIHTLWFDFRQKLEKGEPMSEKDFMTQLDAPALLVKHRPANEHRNVIWNAMYQSFVNNPQKFKDPQLGWVGRWLINNAPKGIDKPQLIKEVTWAEKYNVKLKLEEDHRKFIEEGEAERERTELLQEKVMRGVQQLQTFGPNDKFDPEDVSSQLTVDSKENLDPKKPEMSNGDKRPQVFGAGALKQEVERTRRYLGQQNPDLSLEKDANEIRRRERSSSEPPPKNRTRI